MLNIFKRKKSAKTDYTVAMYPKTRRAVFFDVLKLNWFSFIGYGLLFLAFCLPLIVVKILEMFLINDAYLVEDPAERAAQIMSAQITGAVLMIPAILIVFIGLSGLSRVIRQYAWEEVVCFSSDFVLGIKMNIKQMLPLGLLPGIALLITTISLNLMSVTSDTLNSIVLILPTVFTLLIVLPMTIYAAICIAVYEYPFAKILRLGAGSIFAAPLKTVVLLISTLAPLLLTLISNMGWQLAGLALTAIIFPTVLLAWFLVAYETFDKTINIDYYPELIGKGIFREESEEENN